MIVTSDTLMEIAFIIFMALVTAGGIALMTFLLMLIVSAISYHKRMKPLNEEVEKQKKEAAERRNKLFSS